MASGIPPLLPASPPPMNKDDFNEIDTDDSADDDNDEFGDFSVATPTNNSNKPPNNVNISDEIKPTMLEKNSSDPEKIQVSDYEPANSSHQEQNGDEKSGTVQLQNEKPVDELKTSTDDDTIINSFVTVEMPSVADSQFDSPPSDAANLILNYENAINDNVKNDLNFYNEISPLENNFTIDSPSLSDSDSIDLPDDSFIICEETNSNHASDFLANSEITNEIDPVFGEFVTSKVENLNSDPDLFAKISALNMGSTDTAVLDPDFESELQNSDSFFKPFAEVSTTLSSKKVTSLEFVDVFRAEINGPLSDPLPNSIEKKSQNEEIASVQFNCESDDDDDFSDFVSPTIFVPSTVTEESKCDPMIIQSDKFEEEPVSSCTTNDFVFNDTCLFEQNKMLTTSQELNWTEIFCAPSEDHIEVNVNTIEGKLKCSSVWCKIKDIENSPALHYNWNDSDANKLLLATLCVDSRNILFGPRWNSEVPRFASNLGFTPLVPQKAAEKSALNEFPDLSSEIITEVVAPFPELNPVVSSVPDAHFDWNNSGLTNPLDSYSHSSLLDLDLLASFDIHSPYYRKKSKPEKNTVPENYELQNSLLILKGSETKMLSTEATKILNSLPDLVVMEKQYIVFPLR